MPWGGPGGLRYSLGLAETFKEGLMANYLQDKVAIVTGAGRASDGAWPS